MARARRAATPNISRQQSLDAVVLVSERVATAETDKGLTKLLIPVPTPPWVAKVVRFLGRTPKDGVRDIELDEIGSFVWQYFDGETTVVTIINKLSERYKLNRKEAEVALTSFIRTLAKKRIIFLAIPEVDKKGP